MKKGLMTIVVFLVVLVCITPAWTAEIKVNGLAQTQFVYDASLIGKETSFTVKRARAIVKGDLGDNIGLFSQLEMFTNAINILDLVIDYNVVGVAKIGVGRFTKPFGLQNPGSSYNLHTVNYAQVVSRLIGSGSRDFGVRLIGNCAGIDWTVAVINGNDGGATVSTATVANTVTGVVTTTVSSTDSNIAKDIVARIGITPFENLTIGSSIYKDSSSSEATSRVGGNLKYEKTPIYIQVEYIYGKDGGLDRNGGYIEAGYSIEKIQPIVRAEYYDGNASVEDSSEIMIAAFGLNYYINDSAKIQLICELKKDKLGAGLTDAMNDGFIIQTAVKF
ncbi:MAG: hypothetical protein ABH873_00610 [Candidatus Firestonebacteria bacterium]